ncbi:VPLPA-CTERM sorting domain-containing protein [Pseudooceanicola onchidii]|uniref:VPLPA-CTERM sorting domain-containing protein n=1 Tax=Pseudooceanicola onchidii TaxID=2562279 RepID=UPI0010A9D91F|nr:VPLPA-CTERM sorting domain-containing protein [Pseudooceanicola onchidii]
MTFLCRTASAAAILIAAATSAYAGTINRTGTGLLTETGVSFPNQAPTSVGSSLFFDTGTVVNPILIRWDLLDAGSIAVGDATQTVSATLNVTRTSDDFDFSIGLWDGLNYVSILPHVDGFATFSNYDATSDGSVQMQTLVNLGNNPQTSIGGSFDFTVNWTLADGATEIALDILGNSYSGSTTNPFDRTNALSLLIAKQTLGETFQVNAISVTAPDFGSETTVVPLPATLPLILAALGGLGFVARRRRA